MARLSDIVHPVYQKFLPVAERFGIKLDLDFADTTCTVDDDAALLTELLNGELRAALKRAQRSRSKRLVLKVTPREITIHDPATILSRAVLTTLNHQSDVQVSSRVGFGTTVKIPLQATK